MATQVYQETLNDFQETEEAPIYAVVDGAGDFIECHDVNRLAMLHITSPPTTSPVPEPTSTDHCKSCGGSMKRRSPSTPSAERRFHKKIILQQPSCDTHQHRRRPRRRFHGYTKLALPTLNSTAAVPNSPAITSAAVNPPLGTPESKIRVVPTTNPASAKSTTNGLLHPPPRPLTRSCTAPSTTFDAAFRGKGLISSEDKLISAQRLKRMKDSMREMSQWCSEVIYEGEEHVPFEENFDEFIEKLDDSPTVSKIDRAYTAPSSTFDVLLRNKDLDTSKEKSYSAKKLKGMKDRVKEMHQWCGQVIHEDEEQTGSEENNDSNPKDGSDTETELVPAARVEMAGGCFVIQFKCPCEKVYQLLFSDTHIYYMLMPIHQDGQEKESEEKISVERNDNWLVITTKCPCKKGYRVLLSGKVCFYHLI